MSTITPKFLSLKYQNDCIYIHYLKQGKSYRRQMPVRDLEKGSEIIVDRLISHHSPLLNSINQDQLLAFVNLLKTKDFNKLDDAQLTKVKEDMEKGFIKNQISVKDPNFEYDIRVRISILNFRSTLIKKMQSRVNGMKLFLKKILVIFQLMIFWEICSL